jgi:hypothetical protein
MFIMSLVTRWRLEYYFVWCLKGRKRDTYQVEECGRVVKVRATGRFPLGSSTRSRAGSFPMVPQRGRCHRYVFGSYMRSHGATLLWSVLIWNSLCYGLCYAMLHISVSCFGSSVFHHALKSVMLWFILWYKSCSKSRVIVMNFGMSWSLKSSLSSSSYSIVLLAPIISHCWKLPLVIWSLVLHTLLIFVCLTAFLFSNS